MTLELSCIRYILYTQAAQLWRIKHQSLSQGIWESHDIAVPTECHQRRSAENNVGEAIPQVRV